MTKTLQYKKEKKKVNINHRLSDTAVDYHERLRRQFQQAFGTSNSSSTFERTVEGKIEIINSKTEQQKDEEFQKQYNSFKNNEDMSMSNIKKKDEHYAEMMSIQGII
jgi:CO dehydrogenase/acetyl-CoA synthase epsilon subunit